MKKVAFHNLGCKVNSYELDIMRQILREEGYEEVPFQDMADVYVVNTCTVTNIADRKSRQMLHRAKKQNPDAIVIAVGCYVETDPGRVEKDDAVDLVIGNNKKSEIGNVLSSYLAFRRERQAVKNSEDRSVLSADQKGKSAPQTAPQTAASTENNEGKDIDRLGVAESSGHPGYSGKSGAFENPGPSPKPVIREDLTCSPAFEDMRLTDPGHTRAYIKIQDGCNQFCSYCIIPFARGRIRSRAKQEILEEVTGLVKKGIREVVLTGIHVSSYGLDVDAEGPVRFDPQKSGAALLDLFTELNALEGLQRIRLGSLEPRIMTEKFIAGISRLEKICPHFHLSLQSGCDETLRRMNRHYTTAEFAGSVRLLRQYYDRPAITTDVIVGFPGETREEFETTCAFLEKINFYEIHVFRYSRRNGTAAARMKNQIPEQVKAERSDRLLAMTEAQAKAFRAQFAGEEETLLLEEICDYGGKNYWIGNTMRYVTGAVKIGEAEAAEAVGATGKAGEAEAAGAAEAAGEAKASGTEGEAGAAGTADNSGTVEKELHPGVLLKGTFSRETIPFSRGAAELFIAKNQ